MVTPLSLAPGFSRVTAGARLENRFNGFLHLAKAAEAALVLAALNTRLKPGANETTTLDSPPHSPNPV